MDEQKASDTVSEVSESGTSACTFSSRRDELQEFALALGLRDADQLHQERFRVNRRRMEDLLSEDGEIELTANDFFQKIMMETRTKVFWPSRLKIGSKSNKDPHIRIAGCYEEVKTAKAKIMSVLDVRSNRVTMKLDVSYTYHSHIIGKGGQTVRRVMDETGCHIHFPDSNRKNLLEKSNQVSIAGEIQNVENSRARIRELSPLIFTFELPVLGTMPTALDLTSPYIISIQEKYNVQVKFRTRAKLYSTLVVVKGCEWELPQVEEATLLLVKHMCGSLASQNQNQIQMIMEISPQHHPIVRGKDDTNLMRIMQLTGTQIVFPDVQNPFIPSLKKSTVTITGSLRKVYLARQLLMGSLPLVFIFEVDDDCLSDSEQINVLMHNLDLSITFRQKPRYETKSVIIKGIEREANNIYEAYRLLKGSNVIKVTANIPPTYNVPSISKLFEEDSGTEMMNQQISSNQQGALQLNFASWPINQINGLLTVQNPHILQVPKDGHLGHMSHSLPDISSVSQSSHCSKSSSSQFSPNSIKNMSSGKLPHVSSELNICDDWRAPGFGRALLGYEQLKLQAIQALSNHPVATDLRVPKPTWAGYGFSSSSPPAPSMSDRTSQDADEDGAWGPIPGGEQQPQASSNIFETVPNKLYSPISSSYSDIHLLLASLDLEKYIPNFRDHEIDLVTLRTLSDYDLKEIGVHALGARRKLLRAITEMNRDQVNWLSSTDRKSSSSTNSLNEKW